MNNLLSRRLTALEAQAPDEELIEIHGYVRIGRCLFVPPPMPPAEWARKARESQAALTERERSA